MFPDRLWRWVFWVKGAWNCGISIFGAFFDPWLRGQLGMPSVDPLYPALFFALAFIFGIGYLRVGKDLRRHEFVILGIFGQLSVFAIFTYQLATARVPFSYYIPAIVDLIFAVLFAAFLLTRPRSTGKD